MTVHSRRCAAVVFDLDGVLVDSMVTIRLAFERAYAAVGAPGHAPFDAYLPHVGRPMPEALALLGLPAMMYDEFVRHSRLLTERIPVFPGIPELLDRLRAAGLRLAVATGRPRHRAEHVLEAVGLADRFAAVAGSDEVTAGKPAPDLIALALDRIGAPPGRAAMVGDTVVDLRAARAAGVLVVAASWGQGDRAELAADRPDLIVDSPDDLHLDLLERSAA